MRPVNRRSIKRTLITLDEIAWIRHQLQSTTPSTTKAGLQLLCEHLEAGKYSDELRNFGITISGLMWQTDLLVRRWCYKSLALIGDPSAAEALIGRSGSETDHENLTWIASAITRLNRNSDLVSFRNNFDTNLADCIRLASLLYSSSTSGETKIPEINVDNADGLVLKWCALLTGYDRAPQHLFHSEHQNREMLGNLNRHHSDEVAEYSVWALWKSPEFSFDDLAIPLHDLGNLPENVRRWAFRLITKNAADLEENQDLFQDLCHNSSMKAREGLALGLRELRLPKLRNHIGEWYCREPHTGIKELLLENLAFSDDNFGELFDLVVEDYRSAAVGGSLRLRVRSAANQGGELIKQLKKIDATAYLQQQGLPLELNQPEGYPPTVVNNTNFNIGQMNAQNVAGGNLTSVSNTSRQTIEANQSTVDSVLYEVRELAKQIGTLEGHISGNMIAAADAVQQRPTAENKTSLLKILNGAAGAISIGAAASKIPELVTQVSSWL